LLYGKSNIISAGSSTSLYGIVGTIIGYMIINWGSLSTIGFLFKFKMIVIVVLSLAYLILFTDVAIYVDYWGHLGGFIGGFFLSSINPSLA
jgi:membrane associated rhomboid family serine protease